MAAVANNPKFAKKAGVPRSVGEEFLTADKGKKFKEGGTMKKKMRKFADGGETSSRTPEQRALDIGLKEGSPDYLKAVKTLSSGSSSGLDRMAEMFGGKTKSDLDQLRSNLKSTGRAGMAGAKAAAESIPVVRGAKELASRVGQKSMPKSYDEEKGMKKGGKVHSDIAKDRPMMKKVAAKAVKGHEKRMHGMAKGGKVGQLSKADGCATKGKSKGTMVKMKHGGAC
jgi:hypothetical protein